MTHAITPGLAVSFASAVLYVALGAWVLTLTPRRKATVLLGAFAILFGLEFALIDLSVILHLGDDVIFSLVAPISVRVLNALAILGLAMAVPRRLADRRLLGIAVGIGGAFITVDAIGLFVSPVLRPLDLTRYYVLAAFTLAGAAHWAAAVLLPLRAAPSRDPSVEATTQLAILAVAWAFFWEYIAGTNILDVAAALALGQPGEFVAELSTVAFWLTAAGFWGWNMVRADEDTVRIHRAAMLAPLGVILAGAVSGVVMPSDVTFGLGGIARTIGIGLLAYGVLRHDLAGLDAKVEWSISKTTVAGVFIAVFFVVSEGAQVLFAGFAGSELLGIIAAGALLFALSPIQRLADKIAAKAVPGGAEAGGDVEDRYRREVEVAMADGEISSEEGRHLARRADELGIPAERAFELREEVEDDMSGGDAP